MSQPDDAKFSPRSLSLPNPKPRHVHKHRARGHPAKVSPLAGPNSPIHDKKQPCSIAGLGGH